MSNPTFSKTAKHYDGLAQKYESRWADYLEHTHQRFLAHIKVNAQDIMLDLSCGTGLLAKYIIDRDDIFQKFVLNDIAKDMQHHARKRLAKRSDIIFTSFSAESIESDDRKFTKIFCLNAFHNYHRQSKVLAECGRVLRPGGRFFVLDWNRSGLFQFKNWLIKQNGPEHIDTKSTHEMCSMLQHQSFDIIHENAWYYGTWKFFYLIAKK